MRLSLIERVPSAAGLPSAPPSALAWLSALAWPSDWDFSSAFSLVAIEHLL